MESRIVLPAVALVLALAFGSGDARKCYECKSVGAADDQCTGEMLKSLARPPIECSLDTMNAWHNQIQRDASLNQIANVFEVYTNMDHSQQGPQPAMSCVKLDLRVDNQPVTLRTCQTSKTPTVDPCKATRDKIAKNYHGTATVEYCGMCDTDNCNGSYALSPTMMLSIVPLIGSILMSLMYNSA